MSNTIDMTGRRFGILTVIGRADRPAQGGELRWVCRCDCGNTVIAKGSHLRGGNYTSCGCLHKKKVHATLQRLPRHYVIKYGCHLCADKKECAKFYTENEYIVCKYASILDPHGCYRNYEKAVERKFKDLLRKDTRE